jgi:hypothetical protein
MGEGGDELHLYRELTGSAAAEQTPRLPRRLEATAHRADTDGAADGVREVGGRHPC